ncbi:hypothetical protein F4780DRAFT_67460 [Xylariomycetidae sp. FL0641]|nr:hypothetical protein F4780DRAFT_67460 [Xylariomycetidae sp. FL0641]
MTTPNNATSLMSRDQLHNINQPEDTATFHHGKHSTLDHLKHVLRQNALERGPSPQPLTDSQYSAGLRLLMRNSGSTRFEDFIVSQLHGLLIDAIKHIVYVRVLEVRPGPESVLGQLPGLQRWRISRYIAYEPNLLVAKELKESLLRGPQRKPLFPRLDSKQGLTMPLEDRPSVSAGLWLQGGLGPFSREFGLSCDRIVGAIMVSVATRETLCIGRVPVRHQPAGVIRPENESDLLWAIRGAGTNFGIIINVVFEPHQLPTSVMRNRYAPLPYALATQRARAKSGVDNARQPQKNNSADLHLYL